MRWHRRLIAILLFGVTGCAGLTVKKVDLAHDADYDGVRYYRSSLYLLVHTDNAGGLTAEPMYLPDPSKLMSAHPYAYLSSNTGSMEFANGVLTTSEMDVDSTVVPKAVLSALQAVAVAAIGAGNATQTTTQPPTVPLPKIFKVEVSKGHAHLIGEDGPVAGDVSMQGLHGTKEGGK